MKGLAYYDRYGKVSRISYLTEAALEYFVSIITTGAFLTNLLNYYQFTTAQQGVITTIASLIALLQPLAVICIRSKVHIKSKIIPMLFLNQILFSLLYFTPLLQLDKNLKTFIFVTMLSLGYVLAAIPTPFRNVWEMSNVPNYKRGSFKATMDITSLLSGMIFSAVMGRIVDKYEEMGDMITCFKISGITALIISCVRLVFLFLIKEKTPKNPPPVPTLKENFKAGTIDLFRDKTFLKLIPIYLLYHSGIAVRSFDGTFQRNTLAFSMSFIVLITIISSIMRSVFALPLGKFAEKFSFEKMLRFTLTIMIASFALHIFITSDNGNVTYMLYECIFAIAAGGVASSLFNVVFEYTNPTQTVFYLGWINAIAGIIQFSSSLAISKLVSFIENNGNSIFGIKCSPQQFISIIPIVTFSSLIAYVYFVIRKLPKATENRN